MIELNECWVIIAHEIGRHIQIEGQVWEDISPSINQRST